QSRLASFLLLASLFAMSCAGDPNIPSTDTVSDAFDGSGEAPDAEECVEMNPLVQGGPCDCPGQGVTENDNLCERTCACSGGFWECDQECIDPPSLALVFDSPLVWTEATGNGDTAAQAGEVWQVSTALRAENAQESGVEVNVELRTDDALLVFTESSALTLSDVGETAVAIALQVEIAGAPRSVSLRAEASSGFTVVDQETTLDVVGPNAPSLEWGDVSFERIDGNSNRDIELGERWQLVAELRNGGDAAATGLTLAARASSQALAVDSAPVSSPVDIGVGDTETLRWRFTVAEELIEVEPLVVLTAGADRSTDVVQEVVVPLVPPDTLSVGELTVDEAGDPLLVSVPVTNSAAFDIAGVEWSRINYESFCDPASEPACCGQEGLPECEVPYYRSLNANEPEGPSLLLAGETVDVTMTIPRPDGASNFGRIVLRANSSLRAHGPFLIEVALPVP
ncbi:MAG: hypothetical protein ACI81R_003147, partial [Bradymonadia bacterium]